MANDVEWDPRKAAANLKKHGVDLRATSRSAWTRWVVVVYAWRGDQPRLISARKAEAKEREQYEVKS